MTEASVSFAGNLTDDPEVRYTEGGIVRAMFRVAVSSRREQEASFFTVIVWRDQAEHAAQSLNRRSIVRPDATAAAASPLDDGDCHDGDEHAGDQADAHVVEDQRPQGDTEHATECQAQPDHPDPAVVGRRLAGARRTGIAVAGFAVAVLGHEVLSSRDRLPSIKIIRGR
jgi:Single-strand binding protein family